MAKPKVEQLNIKPKALFFDVFGTVVDWRTSVTKYLADKSFETLNSPASSIGMPVRLACAGIDWAAFAQKWRNSYYEFCSVEANRQDSQPFSTVDEHHHESLQALLTQHEVDGLWTDEEILAISRVWHYLDPWPDSSRGLQALKDQGFVICTLSNGNLSLLKDMAEFANLPWSHVYCAENLGAYKPNPSTYLGACEKLGLKPSQCAMVAAHLGDLRAAAKCGLHTIYIERDGEQSLLKGESREESERNWVDMWVEIQENVLDGGILEVARRVQPHQDQRLQE